MTYHLLRCKHNAIDAQDIVLSVILHLTQQNWSVVNGNDYNNAEYLFDHH